MALSAVLIIGLYFLVLRPRERSVGRSREEATVFSESLDGAARKIASCPQAERQIEDYKKKINEMKAKIGLWSSPRDVGEILVAEARRLELDVYLSRSEDDANGSPAEGAGQQVSFKASTPCSYRAFADYIESIEKAGARIAVYPVSLKKKNAESGTLTAELVVVADLPPE